VAIQDQKGFREILVNLRSGLIAKMRELKSSARDDSTTIRGGDWADRALGSYVQDLQLSRFQLELQRLSSIEAALDRIRLRTYGECQICKKPIGKKRLAAIPWARLCLKCKMGEEQELRLH
jgi:DnaK suppressor protein